MILLLVVALAMMIGVHGMSLFAQAPQACCEMKIVATTTSPSALTITITNLNQPLVTLFKSSSETDFRVRVTTDAGQEVNRTEYGKRLLTQERGGSRIYKELKAGDTTTQTLDLRPLFELKSGTYNVAMSRDVFVGASKVSLEATAAIRIP